MKSRLNAERRTSRREILGSAMLIGAGTLVSSAFPAMGHESPFGWAVQRGNRGHPNTRAAARKATAPSPVTAFGLFADRGLPIGIQLYMLQKELEHDLDDTLGVLAQAGYRTVELAGYAGRTPAQLRRALDRAGLRCAGSHIQPIPRRPGPSLEDDPGMIAEQAHVLGFDTVVMPVFYPPSHISLAPKAGEDAAALLARVVQQMTPDDWRRTADFLNQKARALRPYRLRLSYHNHNSEFAHLPGTDGSVFEMLLARTDPSLVSFELDVGWVAAAGLNPLEVLRRHAGRIDAVHVKDVAKGNVSNTVFLQQPAELGTGVIDWPALLKVAIDHGIARYFVEQEPPFTRPPLVSATASFAYLSRLRR